MKYYIGIDGGGTRTTAAVADENGLVFKKVGATINFYSVGMETARKNLGALVDEIKAGLGVDCFESVFIGCSALDSEGDDELIEKLCKGVINADRIKINSDTYIALKSVRGDANQCVAICGTGSMAIGEDSDGNTYITGGWGHITGDEGSAYAIACEALRHCCVEHDAGKKTPLLESAEKFFAVDDFRKAIDIIYSSQTTKDVIAGFASSVAKLAEAGDETAAKIILSQAQRFAKTVLILLKKMPYCEVLGLYGGVFEHNEDFVAAFCEKIRSVYPDLKICRVDIPPEESALNIAREM